MFAPITFIKANCVAWEAASWPRFCIILVTTRVAISFFSCSFVFGFSFDLALELCVFSWLSCSSVAESFDDEFSVSDDSGSAKFQVNATGVVDAKLNSGALGLPVGASSERPSNPSAGYIRWNSTNSAVEVYTGNEWTEMISEYFPTGSTTFSAHF